MSNRYQPQSVGPKGILISTPSMGILLAEKAGVPTNAIAGYAPGCILIDRTNADVYENKGSKASATWVKIPLDASGNFAVAGNETVGGTLIVTGISTLTGLATLTAGLVNGGTETDSVGGSTAAAGTTTADAGVLPAGTATVYPTTAADDTKGVRVDVADKVTGRMLMIGNGVSNKILKVYAPAGGTINGAGADVAFSSASGKGVTLVCLSSAGNTWLGW